MNKTWYECKVKYLKIDQGGYERRVNDNYLIDAVSFSDAEARIFQQMQEITSGEFKVMNIKPSRINEIIADKEGEYWFKATIKIVSIDEQSGKEKRMSNYILVMADDTKQGIQRIEEGLSYMLIPYVISGIQSSTINEVFPYDLDEGSAEMQKK